MRSGAVALLAVLPALVVGCGAAPAATAVATTSGAGTPTATVTTTAAPSVGATVQNLLPRGATLIRDLTLPLTAPGTQDVVAVYVKGTLRQAAVKDCAGATPGCHVLVAAPTPDGRLRTLWQWGPVGYAPLGLLTAESFTGGKVPELLVSIPAGSTFSSIRVVSFAGGRADVLLADDGANPQVLPPETPGTLPGLAFRHHDTGGSGTWVVWRWDASLDRFVRADGAFVAFYRQEARAAPLTPAGAAWVDYYAALVHLQAGEDAQALHLAQQGFGGVGYMKGSPAFYEIEATVHRREGDCGQAVPLYQQVVASPNPGGGIGWPALNRAYYGLALCAKAAGDGTQAKAYAQQAVSAKGSGAAAASGAPADDWYGFAQAESLLGR